MGLDENMIGNSVSDEISAIMAEDEVRTQDDPKIWVWYIVMAIIACVNMYLMARAYCQATTSTSSYSDLMKDLAVPFVFQTSYRSWFPNQYTSRTVFWDTGLSSILLARFLACIGELCWVCQISHVLRHVDSDTRANKASNRTVSSRSTLSLLATLPMLLIAIAEACSFTCTATKDNLYCGLEESFWGLSFLCFGPIAALLFLRCYQLGIKPTESNGMMTCAVLTIFSIIYVPWEFKDNVPKYIDLWHTEDHDNYLSFHDGIVDAAFTRNMSREYDAWSEFLFWRTAYFSLCAWSSIYLMRAPTVEVPSVVFLPSSQPSK